MRFPHYYKDVSNLDEIDVYRVLTLFEVTHPAIAHAVKKLLCAGTRGNKSEVQDVQEAQEALKRYLQMWSEDETV